MMYVLIQNKLCSCLESTLLFYEKLVGDLESHGFKINPYNPYVENKTVGEKQLTITWHVDNLKYCTLIGKLLQIPSCGCTENGMNI